MRGMIDFFRIICLNKRSLTGLIVLIIFILMAMVGPFVFKLNMTVDYNNRYQFPSLEHWLGTDYAGRDTFIQLVYGSKEVLLVGFLAAFITLIVGAFLGTISGLIGGRLDAT